ncbi:MAG: hypothetical protein ACK5QC_02545 [Bacteroidota bacterium]|jgi:hypothetical protein
MKRNFSLFLLSLTLSISLFAHQDTLQKKSIKKSFGVNLTLENGFEILKATKFSGSPGWEKDSKFKYYFLIFNISKEFKLASGISISPAFKNIFYQNHSRLTSIGNDGFNNYRYESFYKIRQAFSFFGLEVKKTFMIPRIKNRSFHIKLSIFKLIYSQTDFESNEKEYINNALTQNFDGSSFINTGIPETNNGWFKKRKINNSLLNSLTLGYTYFSFKHPLTLSINGYFSKFFGYQLLTNYALSVGIALTI